MLLFIFPLYEVGVVYELVKVTQIALFYEFDEFFLIELDFFYSLFFSHLVKKIVLEKSHVIKLYKVTKIKGYKETTVHLYTLHCE